MSGPRQSATARCTSDEGVLSTSISVPITLRTCRSMHMRSGSGRLGSVVKGSKVWNLQSFRLHCYKHPQKMLLMCMMMKDASDQSRCQHKRQVHKRIAGYLGVAGREVARERAQENDDPLAHAVVARLVLHIFCLKVALKQHQHGGRIGLASLRHDGHACPGRQDCLVEDPFATSAAAEDEELRSSKGYTESLSIKGEEGSAPAATIWARTSSSASARPLPSRKSRTSGTSG